MTEANLPTKSMWNKVIPRTNLVFMIISLALVFLLDLIILLGQPSLMGFWVIMLMVLGIFAVFFFLENYLFREQFVNTKSSLDPLILVTITVRNIVFVLNFIPVIQVLGAMLLFAGFFPSFTNTLIRNGGLGIYEPFLFTAPVLLCTYVVLIACRFVVAKK